MKTSATINSYSVKEYTKKVILNSAQAYNVINQISMNASDSVKLVVHKILCNPCTVQINRNINSAISIYSPFGILRFEKRDCQKARYLIIAAITAKNYNHFYANIKKKLRQEIVKNVNISKNSLRDICI